MTRHNRAIFVLMLAICATDASTSVAVDVWVTTGDKSRLLQQQSDVVFEPGPGSGGTAVNVIPSTTYQTIVGFGASMTDASAWLLENKLSETQRNKLMQQLFSPTAGIGLNYLRVPIGASDFTASGYYTYDDNPPGGTDEFQEHFSIGHDEAYIIPRLQQARALNPELKLMASPWSAPAWMKTNNSLTGGSLKSQWEAAYARYLAKFVQAYEAEGLPIDTLTLQNEPLHTSNYPTMFMSAAQQIDLLKYNVGPLFADENISTKLLAYDHNWDNTAYPIEVLNDPDAAVYLAGTAFHAYAGNVTAQSTVHDAHPDKDIYFTEITGGDWATNFSDNLVWDFQNIIIGNVRNWGNSALFWNLALDQDHNPHLNGCSNCRGIVTINNTTSDVTFSEDFYALGQVTKAVQPGAVRINSTSSNTINTVAFLNPDGSRALVALNPNSTSATARIYEAGQHFSYLIPGKSVATFLWNDTGADFDNGGFDDGGFQLGGGSLDAWTTFGDTTGNVTAANEAVLSGDKSLKLFGRFNGSSNASGVWQGISAKAGDQITAELSALVRSNDSISATTNYAQMKIQYYDQFGGAFDSANFLGEDQLLIADASTANDMWNVRQLVGVAPAGTVEARLVLQFIQPDNQTGAVHIDNVAFGVTGVAILTGDYDASGTVDESDYMTWKNNFGSTTSLDADGNGNGAVDAADYVIWRNHLGTTLRPDLTSGTGVPEPAGLPLAIGGLLGVMGLPGRVVHHTPISNSTSKDTDCPRLVRPRSH
jgi:glucosylceramidase